MRMLPPSLVLCNCSFANSNSKPCAPPPPPPPVPLPTTALVTPLAHTRHRFVCAVAWRQNYKSKEGRSQQFKWSWLLVRGHPTHSEHTTHNAQRTTHNATTRPVHVPPSACPHLSPPPPLHTHTRTLLFCMLQRLIRHSCWIGNTKSSKCSKGGAQCTSPPPHHHHHHRP
jgi:hypothetical protein